MSDRAERVAARFGADSVGRSPEDWRRRSSVAILGLLVFVDYLLVAILVTVEMSVLERMGLAAGVGSLLAFTVAEALYVLRPDPERLRRADSMALFAAGLCLAIVVVATVVGWATGELF